MKAAWLPILLCTVAFEGASANPLNLALGSWEITYFLRNFSVSADGQHELEAGVSGPYTERACVTERALKNGLVLPGMKRPIVAEHCKVTTISKTSNLIDSVIECSAYESVPAYVTHIVVSALTPKSLITIGETTYLGPNNDGSISRSTSYTRGKWLKNDCDK